MRLVKNDGTLFWALIEAITARDESGASVCRAVLNDITERKLAELELVSAQQDLKEAHYLAHIGTWEWIIETDTVTWSEELYKIMGIDPSLPPPAYAEQQRIYTPDSWELLSIAVTKAINTGEPYNIELELVRPDGSIRWANAFGGVRRDNNGKIVRLNGTLKDITERKMVEKKLHESSERKRKILQTAMDGFWRSDMNGRLLEVNDTYCNMSGYSEQELLALSISDLEVEETAEETAVHIQNIIKQGEDRFVSRHRRKDGSTYYVEASVKFQPYDNGQMVTFIRDITNRRQAEESLLLKNRMLAAINDYTQEIVFADPDKLYKTIVTKLKEITQSAEVLINDYDEEHSDLVFCESTLSEENNTWLRKKLGNRFINFRSPVSKKQYDEIMGLTIGRVGTLTDVTFGAIPAPVSRLIEKAFSFGWFVGLALKHKDLLVGTIMIAGKMGQTEPGDEELLAYANATANVLARRRAEIAMAESEELYRSLFANMLNGFAYCRMIFNEERPTDFVYLAVNNAFEKMTGLKNVVGKKVSDVIPGITKLDAQLIEIYGRVAMSGSPEKFEMYIESLKMWFSVSVYSPEKKYFVSVFEGITERKDAEKALQESEERYRGLVQNINDVIFTLDLDGKFTFISPVIEKLSGYTPAEVVGRPFSFFVHPDDLGGLNEAAGKTLSGQQGGYEFRVLDKNGALRWAYTKSKLVTENGKPVNVTGILTDITDRKLAEDALYEVKSEKSELSEKLNEAQHVAMFGSWDWNLLTDKVWWSNETYLIFGVTPQDFVPSFEENGKFIHPDDLEMYSKSFEHSIQTGEPLDVQLRLIARDGSLKNCQANGKVVQDSSGKPIRFIGTVMDITDRKRAEEEKTKLEAQFHQAQKMESVGRLAGGVAHDFNNMLAVILGYTEMALMKISPENPQYAYLEEIRKASERSTDLTRQLLAFARKQIIAPKVLDLNETVESTLNMLNKMIGENIKLNWLPGKGVWPVKMDPSQIDQILANLCINSRDAISDVGTITIETDNIVFDEAYCSTHPDIAPGDYVQLSISDNGCGMDRETLANVFEPFFTTKEVGKGTGLGLATVYGIVKQNKGYINVYSEQGFGATFAIYLHRYEGGTEKEQSDGAQEKAPHGHETILLVEDEPAILIMTTMMLQQLEYTILAASSPGQAIHLAEEYAGDEIHLLLTDVIMPEMNGNNLARNLLTVYPHIKILFMSGYTSNVIAHHGVLDEGVHFIRKPFLIKELAYKLREVLDEK